MKAEKSLTDRAVDGVAWQFFAVGGNFMLRALILILLTRSLEAREFGIVAAATVILTIAERIGLIGVDRVLVQRLDLTDTHISSAFAISLWSGCALAIPAYFGADLFAGWMNIPEMAPIMRFLSASLVLGSLAQVPAAMLQRDLRFKALSIADVVSYLLGFGIVALPLAIIGYGAWALAIGAMVQVASRTFLLYVLGRPALALLPQRRVIGDLVRPGVAFSIGSIGNYLATNIDNLIVGRMLGADALGYYSRAYQFLMLPALMVGKAVSSVLFPTMASLQDQPERVGRAYLRAVGLIALLTLPVSGFLIIVAPELVRFLLGDGWISMIVPFQILISTLLFRTSYKISDAVCNAMGSMRARAVRQWLYAGLVAAGAYFGSEWGLAGVCIGVGLAVFSNFVMMTQLAQRILGLSIGAVVRVHLVQLRNAAIICLPAWLVVAACRQAGLADIVTLVLGSAAAALIVAAIWFLFRGLLGELGTWLYDLMTARISDFRERSKRKGGQ